MLALRRLEDAERDGDKIYAVLRGIGSSSDGRASKAFTLLVPRGRKSPFAELTSVPVMVWKELP